MASVNDFHLTIQQALLFLRLCGRENSGLMTELSDQVIIGQAIEENPPPVTDVEVQGAADRFRARNGLFSADATRRWLEEMGLSAERYEELMRQSVRMEKFKNHVTEDQVERYLQGHAEEFERLHFFRICCSTYAAAARLAKLAREKGLFAAAQAQVEGGKWNLKGELTCRMAGEVDAALSRALPGAVIGPIPQGTRYWVAEVLRRQTEPDAATRAAVRDRLFRDWLSERRKHAQVQWHWM